ncbi:MAG: hypothetical protein KGJ90_02105 [Patescibacteria group bacterium]|nr:hypothetical protein [Patescibacteria group bacterium]
MWHEEKETGDIVIDGWEQGIAPSPHKGIGNLQCADISTIPGEVMCNYNRIRQSQNATISPLTLAANTSSTLTANAGTALLVGVWINVTATTITNLGAGYWYVLTNASGTITVSSSFEGTAVSTLGVTGTATYSVVSMGKPIAWTYDDVKTFPALRYWILDSNGNLWTFTFAPSAVGYASTDQTWRCVTGNGVGNTSASGIAVYGSYLLIAAATVLYYKIDTLAHQQAGMSNFGTSAHLNTTKVHYMLHGHDEVIYITDGNTLASLTVVAGHDPDYFDPTNSATYTYVTAYGGGTPALQLPFVEVMTSLAELNTNLVIGCWSANLYLWNRTPVPIGNGQSLNSFFYPLILPERYVSSMVTVNNLVYIFCGTQGNIYITNGTTISTVLTIPDYTTGQVKPYYQWGGTMYLRNRIWFSVMDSNSKIGGVWSFVPQLGYYIEQDTGSSLRLEAKNSYGTYAGVDSVLIPVLEIGAESSTQVAGQQARGAQYFSGWDDGTSGGSSNPYGVDFSDTVPYTGGQTIIETDLIPVGSILGRQKKTPANIEFTLGAPLVSGESVAINFRGDLTSSFSTAGTVNYENGTAVGAVAGYISPHLIQNEIWLQLQLVLTSTTSSPSFVRLKEVRIRQN